MRNNHQCLLLAIAACLLGVDVARAESDLVAGEVRKLAGGFRFTEGPAANAKGDVYFTDIPNERIHVWTVEGELKTFRENSGQANGLYFDAEGNLLACEGGNRRVTSIAPDGKVTVLADAYEGKKLNSPNDLWIDPKGGVYFTDPRYGSEEGRELEGYYVFYISPDRKKVSLVIDDLVKPNGIIGTPDGKILYVADAGGRKIYRYSIGDDAASLSGRTEFAPQGSDGMALDEKGNLYLTSGKVTVYNPEGEKIAEIVTPEGPANLTFGGAGGKTLFITARTSLYAVPMKVTGAGSAR